MLGKGIYLFIFVFIYLRLSCSVTINVFTWIVSELSFLLCSFFQGNIANVISTIQANKITEDGSQAVQGLVIR